MPPRVEPESLIERIGHWTLFMGSVVLLVAFALFPAGVRGGAEVTSVLQVTVGGVFACCLAAGLWLRCLPVVLLSQALLLGLLAVIHSVHADLVTGLGASLLGLMVLWGTSGGEGESD
jgi:hypothetical protein